MTKFIFSLLGFLRLHKLEQTFLRYIYRKCHKETLKFDAKLRNALGGEYEELIMHHVTGMIK